jgi:hypothetical protein
MDWVAITWEPQQYSRNNGELLLETVFSTRSVRRDYKEHNWTDQVSWELSSTREAENSWRYN